MTKNTFELVMPDWAFLDIQRLTGIITMFLLMLEIVMWYKG